MILRNNSRGGDCGHLPVSANPTIACQVGTKTVPVRFSSRKKVHSVQPRHRIVSGAIFYGRAYCGGDEPAGVAVSPGLLTRYSPATKIPFVRRAFAGGMN